MFAPPNSKTSATAPCGSRAGSSGTLDAVETLLQATRSIPVATGIVNIWVEDATDIAAQAAKIQVAHPDRLLLGVGVSHGPGVGERYRRPLSAMRDYLDRLDDAPTPVPLERRVIAAIGGRMFALARERAGGSHRYLMPPEHTRLAREALGPGQLLAPEQTVVLDTDPEAARAAGREFLAAYLGLPNYTDNLRRVLGFDDADFAGGGSDRLVDATIARGDEHVIASEFTPICRPVPITSACRSRRRGTTCPSLSCVAFRRR